MSWLRCGGLFASLLVLSACSVLPREQASHSAAQQSEMRRASVQQWVLKARLVTADQRASLRWRQQRDEFDLLLRGPFGFGGVRIVGTPQRVTIDDGKNVEISDDPQFDIYQRTGLVVPLAALGWWVRGVPAPGQSAELSRDVVGHLSEIRQSGWVVQLGDYQAVDDVLMPQSIRLENEPWFLDLDVSRWQLD